MRQRNRDGEAARWRHRVRDLEREIEALTARLRRVQRAAVLDALSRYELPAGSAADLLAVCAIDPDTLLDGDGLPDHSQIQKIVASIHGIGPGR